MKSKVQSFISSCQSLTMVTSYAAIYHRFFFHVSQNIYLPLKDIPVTDTNNLRVYFIYIKYTGTYIH